MSSMLFPSRKGTEAMTTSQVALRSDKLTPYERAVVIEDVDDERDYEGNDDVVSLVDRQLLTALIETGSKAKAAKLTGLVPVIASNVTAAAVASKHLRQAGLTEWLLGAYEAVDLHIEDIIGTLKRNLGAYRIEVNNKTGDIVNLGPDVRGSNEAARILLHYLSLEPAKIAGKASNRVTTNQINNFSWGVKPISEEHIEIVDGESYEVSEE